MERINVNNGKVTGITTKDGKKYKTLIVISNAGLRQIILKLVSKEYYTKDYIDWVLNLEHNLACVGFRWILNNPVLTYPTIVLYLEGCVTKFSEFVEMTEGKKTR